MFKNNINYPIISVIVPFYNSSETIDETLCSVESQTYPSVEIIVVNDGSNEYHSNKLKQILSNRPHVQLVEQPNKGPASARNLGARQASGVCFCFLDSDDVIKPQYLSACAEVLKDPKIKLVYTKAEFFGACEGNWNLPPYEGLKSILLGNRIPAVALQRSKDFFELGGFDESLRTHEDWDYWIRLLQNEGDVVCIQDVLFRYRKRSDGTSLMDQLGREPRRIQEDWQKIYDKHCSLYLQHNLGYYDLIVQLNRMEQSERMLSTHLKDVSEFKDALASQLNEVNASKRLLEGQLNETSNHKSLLEVQLTEISDSKSLIENQLESANQSSQMLKAQLDEMIQLNGQLDRRYQKYKKLWTVRLVKPIIKTEQAISSANTLRKGFRRLVKEKGSLGKGYQHLRRLKKSQGTKAVKALLRAIATTTSSSVSNIVDTVAVGSGYRYAEPTCPKNIDDIFLNMKNKPLFSIVVPIYNTPINLLDELIQSIKNQWYQNWELILVDDCSPNQDLRNKLYDITDSQIKVVFLEKNSGISEATNAGIDISRGEYIVFADHDDLITVDCLYELALCINQDDPDMIYSDEDKIDERSRCYSQPHFKPDWSPDTLMSLAYICHITCIRKTILSKTGLLNKEVDGAQDWDLTLRVSEVTQKIKHIPKVLYHWRIIPQSTAGGIEAKPYVVNASRKVRQDALSRRGLEAELEPLGSSGQFRVNYKPKGTPLVSIIIPTRDNKEILQNCIESVFTQTAYQNYEIVVVDNGSVDLKTVTYLSELSNSGKVRVFHKNIPFNFSKLCNFGADCAKGDFLLFLNDDTEIIQSDWLERMVGYAQLSHIGAVGAKLLYPKEKLIQHAGVLNLAVGPCHAFARKNPRHDYYFWRNTIEYNWLAVTAACLVIERQKFDAIGRFDEELAVNYNDVALCFSCVTHGYYNVMCQAVTLYHYESFSRGLDNVSQEKRDKLQQEMQMLYKKFPMFYQHDPFYNVNLHPNGTNFELPF